MSCIKPRPGAVYNYSHPLAQDLIAYFLMNEYTGLVVDNVVGSVNGILSATGLWSGNPFGGGIKFDGTNRLDVPSVFGMNTSDISLSCWVYIFSLPSKGAFVKVGSGSPSLNGFGIGISNGGATGFETSGSNLTVLIENIAWHPTGLTPGTGWIHYVMTIAGTTSCKIYKNGSLYTSFTNSAMIAPATQTYIGGYTSSTPTNRHTPNIVDEVRLYNRVLTPSEVHMLYVDPHIDFYKPHLL